jgi:hypothetical protein
MWHFLTNKSQAADVLGEKMWSFVPKQWRYFWMQELKNEFPLVYASISITHPRPHFREMSYEVNDFNGILKRGLLGEIKHGCNQYLNAVVLCPWGCCEFPHKAGNIQLDVVFQRYIQFSAVSLHSDKAVLLKVRNARNDFIGGERDCLLMNPEWEISPTIAYIEGIGPRVLTCCDHNGGCTKRYFHSPRTGITIPAPGGDQLSHAVVQPRTVKKSVAKTYSDRFEVVRCQGTYTGIDSADITEKQNFSKYSVVQEVHESRSIRGRVDIRGLVPQLTASGVIDKSLESAMLMRSEELYPDTNVLDILASGTTYMTLSDTMLLQKELSTSSEMSVAKIDGMKLVDATPNETTYFQRHWPSFLVHIHHNTKHGSMFSEIPTFAHKALPHIDEQRPVVRSKEPDFRLLWTLTSLLVCVPGLWSALSDGVQNQFQWSGFFLSFCANSVLTDSCKHRNSKSPFLFSQTGVKKSTELLGRCQHGLSEEKKFEIDLGFNAIQVDWVLKNAGLAGRVFSTQCETVTSDSFDVENATNVDTFVFVQSGESDSHLTENIVCSATGDGFELRFLSKTRQNTRGSRLSWTGRVLARHGGCFTSWWEKDRTRITLPLEREMLGFNDTKEWEVAVYARVKKLNIDTIRNDCMEYVGGQKYVQCQSHKIPLIIASPFLSERRPQLKCYEVSLHRRSFFVIIKSLRC